MKFPPGGLIYQKYKYDTNGKNYNNGNNNINSNYGNSNNKTNIIGPESD
jgi:hypothetical protein